MPSPRSFVEKKTEPGLGVPTSVDRNTRLALENIIENLRKALGRITVLEGDVTGINSTISTSSGDTINNIITGGEITVEAEAAVMLRAGQAVYVNRVTGRFGLTLVDTQEHSTCVGLATADFLAGSVGTAAVGRLELVDWSNVVGSVTLSSGQNYFLTTVDGHLSTTPPGITGQFVGAVGTAVSASVMLVDVQPTVLL